MEVHDRRGVRVIESDEHPRRDTSLGTLGRLKPILLKDDSDATVTAGNASGQNDAAALMPVATRESVERLGVRSQIRLVSWAVAGVGPEVMGIGPVPASAAARADLTLADLDLLEVNEAFAAQVLAVYREWDSARTTWRTHVNGSGISLGHPVGATRARMLGTLGRELHRREARYSLATMCSGGGHGLAAIVGRVDA